MTRNLRNTLIGSALTAALCGFAPTTSAAPVVLTSGDITTTNGSVEIGVDGYGNFGGPDLRPDTGSALLRESPPAGAPGFQETTQTSYVALRFAGLAEDPYTAQLDGQAQLIGSGSLTSSLGGTFVGPDGGNNTSPPPAGTATSLTSSFSGLDFSSNQGGIDYRRDIDIMLTQSIESYTNPTDGKTNTVLTQKYVITNNSAQEIVGELLRYANFDLDFGGGGIFSNGGGLVYKDGTQYMMMTRDTLDNPQSSQVYAAISAEVEGQANPINDRYALDLITLLNDIVLETSLGGGHVGLDNYIDGLGPGQALDQNVLGPNQDDYAVALRNVFTLGAAGSGNDTITYLTRTYWGDGSVQNFEPPPVNGGPTVPTAGTAPLIGLASLGLVATLRRRRRHSS